MQKTKRILTIDVMRGLTLFLMLFVNDLYAPGVPEWLTHRPAGYDGLGLADWVFPGFLFMVGLAVPYAVQSRIKRGDSRGILLFHILSRTLSLLIIGVMMFNVSQFNQELTGMNKNLWAILAYASVFLIWNQYKNLKQIFSNSLKGLGVIGLIYLAVIFKGGTPEDTVWLRTGWWGILGLIAWGYLVTSVTYLFTKNNLLKTGLVWLFFMSLNVLSKLGLTSFLDVVNPVLGVITDGLIPSIVLAGLFFSLILRKYGKMEVKKFILIGISLGLIVLLIGFILRNWFIISKMEGTPSWAMVCNGISIILFVILYFIIDVLGKHKWFVFLKPAGQNSLTTYLAPDFFYYSIWMSGLPILYYKQSEIEIVVVLGSIAWALIMIGFAALISKIGIRLKL